MTKNLWRDSVADEALKAFDRFHHALTVIDEEHRAIHEGFVYSIVATEEDIPDGDSRYSLYRVHDTPIHLKRFNITASEGPVLLTIYESPVLTDPGGPPLNEPINLNRMSSRVPTMEVFNSPTFTSPGDPVLGSLYIPADGNAGVSGETGAVQEIILAANTDYLIEFVNDPAGAGTADVYAVVVFYELDYIS